MAKQDGSTSTTEGVEQIEKGSLQDFDFDNDQEFLE